jgi:AbrB family looped-hinge helix DNA binding protein
MAVDVQYEAVKVDERGRITLPKSMRDDMDIQDNATLFVRREGDMIELAKADLNPFEVLGEHARREHERGNTRVIREPDDE